MNKLTLLGAAAALSLGLTCNMAAQKKIEYMGPPVKEGEKPKAEKQDSGKTVTPPPANSSPQTGQAAGFGVGTPGGKPADGQPVVETRPPLQNPPENTLPPVGPPNETKGEVILPPAGPDDMKPEVDRPIGPPAKEKGAAADAQPAASKPARQRLASKTTRPRRVRKG